MFIRSISITERVEWFLATYERRLQFRGDDQTHIEQVALDLFLTIFDKIPRGKLARDPIYLGKDPTLPGYSVYSFSEGSIHGSYTTNGEHVILLNLAAYRPPAIQKRAARTSAA